MKRKKSSRMRGKRTYGYGSQKKHRGAGSRGGRGFAGAFKQKKIYFKKKKPEHYQKKKFKSLRTKGLVSKLKTLNLNSLPDGKDLELPGFKILGNGTAPKNITVRATKFTEKAKQKLGDAGSKFEELKK